VDVFDPAGSLRQRDGVSCGPSIAIIGSALLDPGYARRLAQPGWFAAEQQRLHRELNRFWPRALGTTPAGIARSLSRHGHRTYRWRMIRRNDRLLDVREAVLTGYPVALLVGRLIPRHWVLLTELDGSGFRCYEPSSGQLRRVEAAAIRQRQLVGVGFPRPFCVVLPRRPW